MSESSEAAATVRVEVALDREDADSEEIEELTQRLRRQLLQLDVEGVARPRSGETPPSAKAVDVVQVGELIVRLAQTGPAFAALATVLHRWLRGGTGRQLHIEIGGDKLVLSSATAEQQQAAIAAWLNARSEGGDGTRT
jgi:hypothetical protein